MNAISLRVNGEAVTAEVEPRMHLADFVRETLHLTGTHLGCEHGVCGACTMMVDGRPTRSCLTFASTCSGAEIRTVESFGDDPVMIALHRAFNRFHALQCGYCTPGMLATAYDIVTRLPDADEARIREELSGNLCRCTGYAGIVAAIGHVLSEGVPEPALRPMERAAVSAESMPAKAQIPRETTKAAQQQAALPPLPERLDNPVVLQRVVDVAVPVDRLWATIRDIETVARCLPGASIEEQTPEGDVLGAFIVAIGPMRATFRGRAKVAFDDDSRTGRVIGSGGDAASRSRADGSIDFRAEETADAGISRLAIEIAYKLSGPLSQFGRPVIVADIVDRLLARFVENLAEAAQGRSVERSAPMGGIGLVSQSLLAMLRGLFRRR